MGNSFLDLVRKPSLASLSDALAGDVAAMLRQAVEERGRATLAVPGGTTPRAFLASLSHHDLPWDRIAVLPTDERDVAADDLRSNERMILENLPGATKSLIPLRRNDMALEAAAVELSRHIKPFCPLDVVVIGMGSDAHVASLFPGDDRLAGGSAERGQAVLAARPTQLEPRLSLGPTALMEARWKALLIAGEEKEAVLSRALQTLDPVSQPVTLLFLEGTVPRIYWAPG
ncbi:6-phosphogluconolactonase [Microvirga pakistanensis]|uniref:6-phosphogluconolactonase n=1 Tax=Microvirga pakistanensis TaxID=1682650 RepID=UPI00141B7500|nr:6-phosphogluconolactonase [Microvirga pakistanensis]